LIIQENSIPCLRNRKPYIGKHSSGVQVQHANKVANFQGSAVIWKPKSHGTVIEGAIVSCNQS
jgi:ribosomal protein L35AE/L33A